MPAPARLLALAAASIAGLSAFAAPAPAAELRAVARASFVTAGPAISGDRFAFATTPRAGASVISLLQGRLGGPAPTVRFTRAAESRGAIGELSGADLALSATRTAFAFGEFLPVDPDGAIAHQRAYTGGADGPLTATAGSGSSLLVNSLDLSGDQLLTLETTSSTRRVMLRDLAAGGPPRQLGGDLVITARIAGDLVALATEESDTVTRVTVVNWRTGAELYRVDVPVTPPYGFGFGLDLQEDGTVAVRAANAASTGSDPKVDLAWASAAAPTLRTVATDVGTQYTRISGGRILFARRHDAMRHQLAIADIATGAVRAASFPVGYIAGADLDGDRVAFATATCVYAGDVPAAAPAIAPTGTCPQTAVALDTQPSRTVGGVRVAVTCLMASSRGCTGTVRVRTPRAPNRKQVTLATRSYTAAAGTKWSFTVLIPRRGRDTLRARAKRGRRTAIVAVNARATDDAGLTATDDRDALVRIR